MSIVKPLKNKKEYFGELFENQDHSISRVSKEVFNMTTKHTRMVCYKEEDVVAAVAWLKQKIKYHHKGCGEHDICMRVDLNYIDKAFEDATK